MIVRRDDRADFNLAMVDVRRRSVSLRTCDAAPPFETFYAELFCVCFCALAFAQRARCAAAILFRAARLILRTGLETLARLAFAHRARWAAAILALAAADIR